MINRRLLFREENNMALDLVAFREEDPFLQKRILLRYMEQLTPYRKDITKEHIEALMQLTQKDGSREIFLPYGLRAYKEYDRLLLTRTEKKKTGSFRQAGSQRRNICRSP
jgi:hypothetical protein